MAAKKKSSGMGTAMKVMMALEIGAAIYLVTVAARAQEQEWRYTAKKLKER